MKFYIETEQASKLVIYQTRFQTNYKKISFRWCFGLYTSWKYCLQPIVHGPILSLHSKKLSISPISAFRPRRWKGKIVNDKSKIIISNLNPSKRPVSAVADNLEVRNAKSITVKINNKIKFNLLMTKIEVYKKIKIEQIRNETS